MEVYQKLVNDIRSGNAVLYSDFRSKMTTIKLRVDRINGIDIIKFWKTKDFQNAQYDYLKRIYDYYYSRGIFDIRDKRFEDFVKIIGNTLDYSYYRGIVQGLLDRTDRGATTKVPLSNLHVDRDKDYNVDLSPQPYIFIIDEINRGEISKIFGELFFSVDPGYRGVKGKVQTQYQNLITEDDPFKDGFYIPENVYIIGTMNDIDRSVECMDFAMRRRFTFKEITAEESGINMGLSGEAIKRMQSLNKAISEVDGFNSSFHIGAAYYLGVTDYNELWELKLQGLLKEYLRGMPDAEETLDTLKKAYELSSQDDNN
ncbi:MAG: AAA family ATPase [Bacteroidaceae bacterium]|nr:AAA family ATPase [Bacteroidaceae bacterium]